MSQNFIFIFALCLMVNFASGQVTGRGACPKVEVVEDFDINQYLGKWFEIKKYPTFFSRNAKCISAEYQLKESGAVSVFNKQVLNGVEDTILGEARVISSGILGVSFPSIPFNKESEYNVLATDYENYAAVFSCSSSPPRVIDGQYAWILSRTRKPSPEIIAAAEAAFVKNGISLDYFQVTDNQNCPKNKSKLKCKPQN